MTAPTAEADVEVTGPAVDGEIPIRALVIIEGADTSDGRFLAAGSLKPRALPLPLLAQPESAHGGDDAGAAGVVGRLDTLERIPGPQVISKRTGQPFPEGTFVWIGTGAISTSAKVGGYDIADLFRRRFLRGISADLAGMDYEVLGDDGAPPDPEHPRRVIVTHSAEIAAATLVPIPAFGDCYAEDVSETESFVPVAPEQLPEGLSAAAAPAWRSSELGEVCGLCAAGLAVSAGEVAVSVPADAVEQLAAVIDGGSGVQRDAAGLAAAIVEFIRQQWVSGEDVAPMPDAPVVVAAGLGMSPAAAAESGDVDDADDSLDDEDAADPEAPQSCEFGDEPAVRSLLFRDGEAYVPVCDAHEQDARDTLEAAGDVVSGVVEIRADGDAADVDEGGGPDAVVAAGAWRPPAGWFADPRLDGPTALQVGEDGRVVGHLATWGQCHVSFPGQCITAPRSPSGYAYFRTGAVLCDDGSEVAVGHITLDTGHAATHLGQHAAAAHYDNTGTVVADVSAGEDEFGIWVAGAVRRNVDEVTVAKLRAAALSGDWRRVGGSLELVAALAVNTPGFPVPRARVAAGAPLSLVAAGVVAPSASLEVGTPASTIAASMFTENTINTVALADQIVEALERRRAEGELTARQQQLLAELDDTPARMAALLAELDDTPARFAAALAPFEVGDGDPKAQR